LRNDVIQSERNDTNGKITGYRESRTTFEAEATYSTHLLVVATWKNDGNRIALQKIHKLNNVTEHIIGRSNATYLRSKTWKR
jgi:hypothetical protein